MGGGEGDETLNSPALPLLDSGSHINARHEPLPEAGAQRTLKAVGSMPLFGFPHAPQSTSRWLISLAPSGDD
jgi:hypothetical protein